MRRKNLWKKVIAAVIAAAMAGSLGACGEKKETQSSGAVTEASGESGSAASSEGGEESGSYSIAVVSSGIYHQFGMAVKDGMVAAAGEENVTMTFDGPETDAEVDKQVDMLKVAIDKKPDAIVLNAIDIAACNSEVERATQMGIPVITCVNGVSSEALWHLSAQEMRKRQELWLQIKWRKPLERPEDRWGLCVQIRIPTGLLGEEMGLSTAARSSIPT